MKYRFNTLFQQKIRNLSKKQAQLKNSKIHISAKTKGIGKFSLIQLFILPYNSTPSHECANKPAKAEDAKNVIYFSPLLIFKDLQNKKR